MFEEDDGGQWLYDSDQSQHEKNGLTLGENEVWTLCVDFPVVGYRYDIVWQLDDGCRPVDALAAAFDELAHKTVVYLPEPDEEEDNLRFGSR